MPTVHPSLHEQVQLKFVSARINHDDAVLKFSNLNALNAQNVTNSLIWEVIWQNDVAQTQ